MSRLLFRNLKILENSQKKKEKKKLKIGLSQFGSEYSKPNSKHYQPSLQDES